MTEPVTPQPRAAHPGECNHWCRTYGCGNENAQMQTYEQTQQAMRFQPPRWYAENETIPPPGQIQYHEEYRTHPQGAGVVVGGWTNATNNMYIGPEDDIDIITTPEVQRRYDRIMERELPKHQTPPGHPWWKRLRHGD